MLLPDGPAEVTSLTAVRSRVRSTIAAPATGERRAGLRPPDMLLPTSVILWAIGVSRTNVTHLGPYGLPAVLPIVFYAGLLMLVASAVVELAQKSPSRVRMALHAVTLVVMLYGTAPLVYQEGRYSWLYKTIGVVQYVNTHGQLNKNIDIYQNWPGFFAFAAWFDKVAGVASPLAYAKWAQLVVELAALPLLYMAYSALSLPARQRWIAILLYSASNWIGQDYFSPQALGTILSLGVIAMALRWMFAGNSTGRRWRRRGWRVNYASERYRSWDSRNSRLTRPLILALVLVFFVLTFTHELSPYVVLMQLAALAAVTGLIRPRWITLVLLAVAVGYFIPRFAFVNSHYGLLYSFGSFFSNAAPPATTATSAGLATPASQLLIQHCSAGLSLAIWLLALVGAWLRRRSRRTVLALVLLAYSPILVLAVGAYGNEGILRVYLFSLPWAAALAAAALAPLPILASRGGHVGEPTLRRPDPILGSALRTSLALVAALALFFPAFFGDDHANLASQTEVDTIDAFMRSAPPGAIFEATSGASGGETSRYPLFPTTVIFGQGALVEGLPKPDIADEIAKTAVGFTGGHEPSYVIVSPSQIAYNNAHPSTSPAGFRILLASLAHSPEWILLIKNDGTYIYELPPGSVFVQPGSPGKDQR
jgi:hypothetical protein